MAETSVSRRTVVKLAGVAASTAALAGCADDNGNDWEDVDSIYLEGYTQNWIGVEPSAIEGEENPTLVLYAGREYEVTWENMDGVEHNFALLDDAEEVLEETERMSGEGETQTHTFEATEEMAQYRCEPHPTTMVGDIEIREEE